MGFIPEVVSKELDALKSLKAPGDPQYNECLSQAYSKQSLKTMRKMLENVPHVYIPTDKGIVSSTDPAFQGQGLYNTQAQYSVSDSGNLDNLPSAYDDNNMFVGGPDQDLLLEEHYVDPFTGKKIHLDGSPAAEKTPSQRQREHDRKRMTGTSPSPSRIGNGNNGNVRYNNTRERAHTRSRSPGSGSGHKQRIRIPSPAAEAANNNESKNTGNNTGNSTGNSTGNNTGSERRPPVNSTGPSAVFSKNSSPYRPGIAERRATNANANAQTQQTQTHSSDINNNKKLGSEKFSREIQGRGREPRTQADWVRWAMQNGLDSPSTRSANSANSGSHQMEDANTYESDPDPAVYNSNTGTQNQAQAQLSQTTLDSYMPPNFPGLVGPAELAQLEAVR